MKVDFVTLGKSLANRRKLLGLTQAKVSEMAGIGEKFLSDIENAHSKPSVETLTNICLALQITPNYLFTNLNTGKDEMFQSKLLLMQNDHLKLKLLYEFMDMLTAFSMIIY